MTSQAPASPAAQPGQTDDNAAIGVGGQTSGQQGATPTHESQQETGGNGGPGLTRNQSGPYVNAPDGAQDATVSHVASAPGADAPAPRTESVDAAMTHANPGAQDTRSGQAGVHETGLGALETGGNQDAGDLPPARR